MNHPQDLSRVFVGCLMGLIINILIIFDQLLVVLKNTGNLYLF